MYTLTYFDLFVMYSLVLLTGLFPLGLRTHCFLERLTTCRSKTESPPSAPSTLVISTVGMVSTLVPFGSDGLD